MKRISEGITLLRGPKWPLGYWCQTLWLPDDLFMIKVLVAYLLKIISHTYCNWSRTMIIWCTTIWSSLVESYMWNLKSYAWVKSLLIWHNYRYNAYAKIQCNSHVLVRLLGKIWCSHSQQTTKTIRCVSHEDHAW